MSRAYLFTLSGEQLDSANWHGDLKVGSVSWTSAVPHRSYVIAVRGRRGYRLRKTPPIREGVTILTAINEKRMSHSDLGPRSDETYLASIHAVRALLKMGGMQE